MGIQYFWHDHPLELRSILSDSGSHCYVCRQSVSGYNYKCPKCNFFLHISCLKLPLKSVHPLHQEHPLTLMREPANDVDGQKVLCNKCTSPCSDFTYHCAACFFSLHLQCTLEPYTLMLDVHKHSLTFSSCPPNGYLSFICNICGEDGSYFCLFCKSCQFVVHIECSSVPATARYERHDHVFELIPMKNIEDGTGEFYCTICEERVNVKGSVYYCADCEYIGHLRCIVSVSEAHLELAYRDADRVEQEKRQLNTLDKQYQFQIGQDEDNELAKLRRCFKELLSGGNVKFSDPMSSNSENKMEELLHFSHDHPLTLCDELKKDRVTCYGCWRKISGMGYLCNQCDFFLHKWCAELPKNLQHPIHPEHSLTLLSRQPNHTYYCEACDKPLDGFSYNCKTCHFNLHAMCASIPRTLRNEIHEHSLILSKKQPDSTKCASCKYNCRNIVFECEICKIVLDLKCALLPHKVKHNCHVDPLILTSLIEDETDEYYCFACEERRQPNHWVYYCPDCDIGAHKNCVVSEIAGGIPEEGPVGFNLHNHLLGLITRAS